VLLIIGACLSILPFLGLWMLPFGLVLLAEDIARLRRALGWMARRKPHWFAAARKRPTEVTAIEKTDASTPPPTARGD
jgi:hypothetical protein